MKSLFPKTIQARLILSHMLVSLISIALIAGYAGQVLFSGVRARVEQDYKDLAREAAGQIEIAFQDYLAGTTSSADIQTRLKELFSQTPEVHFTIYLPDGQAVIDSTGTLPPVATRETSPEIWQAIEASSGLGEHFRKNLIGGEFAILAAQIKPEEQVLGVLRIEAPITQALINASSTLGLFIGIALIVALGTSVLGYFLARSLAGPIKLMTQTAELLAQREMGARVTPPGVPYELHRLAEAINSMASQIQGHVTELRSFVANASHELRTPLTSIKLRVEALREGALDDPAVSYKFLAEIESEVDRLSKMVNDLLDLSRIEAGLEPGKRTTVDLAVIANEVYETFKVRAERAGIRLNTQIASNLPPMSGNEDQIRRMLYNLVDNALKYTQHGGQVDISLQLKAAEALLYLSVRDTGFGIAAAQMPHIFERFYRVEATRPRYGPSQGSGLGLPIAKSIVEAHGGRIGVSSQVGKGTTFWVELPAIM